MRDPLYSLMRNPNRHLHTFKKDITWTIRDLLYYRP
jgi:hypothetical protein